MDYRKIAGAWGIVVCWLIVGWGSSGCGRKPPESSPSSPPEGSLMGPGKGGLLGSSSSGSLEAGDDLPLAHIHAAKGGAQLKRPMGWICTCELGVPQAILILGSLEDPELVAAAQRADAYAAQVGEDQCLAVVITPGPKDEELMKTAQEWQEEHGLDHSLVTVTDAEWDWKQLGAPKQLTLLISDQANTITYKQVGYNEENQADFETALTGEGPE